MRSNSGKAIALVEPSGYDEMRIAAERMRHLLPWNVTPLPPAADASRPPTTRPVISSGKVKRLAGLARVVTLLHIHNCTAGSALD